MENNEIITFEFNPPDGLRDKNTFPTEPEGEDAAREQFMMLFDQMKNYINELVELLKKNGVIS